MQSLCDLQESFKKFVISDEDCAIKNHIVENGWSAQDRMQIYKNNIFITLIETLQSLYPTIQSLVGKEFFIALAREYVAQYPSASGDLHNYGKQFAGFVAAFPHVEMLPYLSEMAQLEWAYHEVFHEEEVEVFDLNKLKTIAEDDYGDIKFKLHPACRLFEFQFPVLQIWKICQTENDQKINSNDEKVALNTKGEKIFVIRRQREVFFENVTAGEFVLLSACNQNKPFEQACALALQAEPEMDINACVKQYFLNGTIVDCFF